MRSTDLFYEELSDRATQGVSQFVKIKKEVAKGSSVLQNSYFDKKYPFNKNVRSYEERAVTAS